MKETSKTIKKPSQIHEDAFGWKDAFDIILESLPRLKDISQVAK